MIEPALDFEHEQVLLALRSLEVEGGIPRISLEALHARVNAWRIRPLGTDRLRVRLAELGAMPARHTVAGGGHRATGPGLVSAHGRRGDGAERTYCLTPAGRGLLAPYELRRADA